MSQLTIALSLMMPPQVTLPSMPPEMPEGPHRLSAAGTLKQQQQAATW